MSGLQGTHIFFVVVSQGKFSLWQYKLPLQKLCVLLPFLPQHPFVETWIQYKSHRCFYTHSSYSKWIWFGCTAKHFAKSDNLGSFHFLAVSLCKEQVFLAQFCKCMRNHIVNNIFTPTDWERFMLYSTHTCKQTLKTYITCGIGKWWILGFSCEFLPFIFSPNPLLS